MGAGTRRQVEGYQKICAKEAESLAADVARRESEALEVRRVVSCERQSECLLRDQHSDPTHP